MQKTLKHYVECVVAGTSDFDNRGAVITILDFLETLHAVLQGEYDWVMDEEQKKRRSKYSVSKHLCNDDELPF